MTALLRILILLSLCLPLASIALADQPSGASDEDSGLGEEQGGDFEADADADARDPEEPLPQWGRGPFEIRDPYILSQRGSPWMRSPETLWHLQLEAALRTTWSNHHAYRGFGGSRVLVDAETREFTFSLRVGLFDRLELGLHVPYGWRGGGTLDRFIENFHRVFGLPDAEREKRKQNRFLIRGVESDGRLVTIDHAGYGLLDSYVELRGLLTEGSDRMPALAATLRLRIPTGRPKFQLSDGVDPTLGLDASKRLGDLPLIVYASFAYTYYAEAHVNGLTQERNRLYIALGVEWEIKSWISLVVHGWWETRREVKLYEDSPFLFRTNLTFGNYISYVAAGFKVSPTPGLTFELGVLENVIDPDVTADLAFMLNASWRY